MSENIKSTPNNFQNWWSRNWVIVLFSFIVILSAVIAITIFFLFWNYPLNFPAESEKFANLGEYFGGITDPIFNFMGLIALLLTIILQNRELRNSSSELENSRKELVKSAIALKNQIKTQKRQSLESIFFRLIQLHHDHINFLAFHVNDASIINKYLGRVVKNNDKIQGRECFLYFYAVLNYMYDKQKKIAINNGNYVSEVDIIQRAYKEFYNKGYQEMLGHYFRNFFNIVNFLEIHRKDLKQQIKKNYIDTIRAQFSDYEAILIFYKGLYLIQEYGQKEFYQQAEKYLLLKNLRKSLLFNEEHYKYYPNNAKFMWK